MPVPKNPSVRLISLLVLSIGLCGACQLFRAPSSVGRPPLPHLESVVVVGFRTDMPEREEPKALRNSVTGRAYSAAPVSAEVVNKMNAKLFEGVRKVAACDLISPGKARSVYSRLVSSDPGRTRVEILQHIGQAFSADAVLVGYIYRWRERVGGDLAAEQPASVAFDLSLLRPEDGAILWREKFDKTQKSLSENLLEWNTFVRGQGRWMTAEKLAELGLEDILSRMPISRNE